MPCALRPSSASSRAASINLSMLNLLGYNPFVLENVPRSQALRQPKGPLWGGGQALRNGSRVNVNQVSKIYGQFQLELSDCFEQSDNYCVNSYSCQGLSSLEARKASNGVL